MPEEYNPRTDPTFEPDELISHNFPKQIGDIFRNIKTPVENEFEQKYITPYKILTMANDLLSDLGRNYHKKLDSSFTEQTKKNIVNELNTLILQAKKIDEELKKEIHKVHQQFEDRLKDIYKKLENYQREYEIGITKAKEVTMPIENETEHVKEQMSGKL